MVSIEAAEPNLDPTTLESLREKNIILGVINLGESAIEAPETVAARIRRALKAVPPERLLVAPDCGMKYLDRSVALAKLKAMVEGAMMVRSSLSSAPLSRNKESDWKSLRRHTSRFPSNQSRP